MNVKESLKELRKNFLSASKPTNRDYEFESVLENHELGNQNIYRLYYINYHRIDEYDGRTDNNTGVINWPFQPFMFPDKMSREDGFKVLSYLTDFIEKSQNLEPCSHKSVSTLNNALDLERLGFRRINVNFSANDSNVIDLFTVTGRLLLFKKSKHYQKYFDWYTENVTFDEVKEIYSKCGIEFYDLVFLEKQNDELQLIRKK